MDANSIIGYVLAAVTLLFGGGVLYFRSNKKQKQADIQKTEVETENLVAETDKIVAETDSIRITNLSAILDKLQCQYDRLEKKVQSLEKEVEDLRTQLVERQKYIVVVESRLSYIISLAKSYIGQLLGVGVEPDKELPKWAEDE